MHLFLYQAARHQKASQWSTRRLSQSTIRCDFDLELLKQGIKGRYEIIGHGIHPFQKAMAKMDMSEEFYGHIIQIDESKNAVWFKLNYDNIGRHVTKYMGGWKDLNADDLETHIARYQDLKNQSNVMKNNQMLCRSQNNYVSTFFSSRNTPLHSSCDKAVKTARRYSDELTEAYAKMAQELATLTNQMDMEQEKVRTYLKEHKG